MSGNINSVKSFVLQFHHQKRKSRLDIPAKMLFVCALSLLCLHVTSYSHAGHSLMMGTGNTFGKLFRISTFGESHGKGVGVVIDGCPPRVAISSEEIQCELDRRRPGQSRLTTPRKEPDIVEILSGVSDGVSLGTPIALLVPNTNQRGGDYDAMSNVYRPSHADATYDAKYGVRAIAGGGRASARETVARVAAGAVAKKILRQYCDLEIVGYVQSVHNISTFDVDHDLVTRDEVEANIVRCPDSKTAEKMIARIDQIRRTGNSVGGVVEVVVRNVPAGLGAPVFDKLEAELARACLSIPACKGFEVGSGFGGTLLTGLEHNDEFYVDAEGRTRTRTNRSGGIQGGISNGENIILRAAFKPTSTIGKEQRTVTRLGGEAVVLGKGRHDPCVLPRAVPVVEAMVALVMVDALMQHTAQCHLLNSCSTGLSFHMDLIEFDTTAGTFCVELYRLHAPKTCYNFTELVKIGYYNDTVFHRVVRDFMVQGGDPTGTGRGGESIFGGKFEDELTSDLKHTGAGVLCMANSGPNSNGSQFFITLAPTPWLDGKHTIFGRVHSGMKTVQRIGSTPTTPQDKPANDIRIMKARVVTDNLLM